MESHRAKLKRAYTHLKSFDDSIQAWVKDGAYRSIPKAEPDEGEYLVWSWTARQEGPFPEDWPLLIGDALFNMRSALDHIAFTLAKAKSGGKIKERDVSFPMFRCRTDFDANLKSTVSQLRQDAIDAIERMQPYSDPDRKSYYPLYVLKKLNDTDKHRRFVFGGMVGGTVGAEVHGRSRAVIGHDTRGIVGNVRTYDPVLNRVGDKAVFARAWLKAVEPDPKMDVQVHITLDPVFPQTERWVGGTPVMRVMTDIYTTIRDSVFPKLEEILNQP